jgi:micrococcal nuclease
VGAERLIPLLAAVAALGTGCQGEAGSGTGEPSAPSDEQAVVDWVVDGDTLHLRNGAKVRLVQIDAPELHTDCYGRASREALIDLARKGRRVTLARDPALDAVDEHGRLLRYVYVGDTNVNVELVRRGAASPYFFRNERGRYADDLLDAVEDARDARRGYWGACPDAELNTGLGSVTGHG